MAPNAAPIAVRALHVAACRAPCHKNDHAGMLLDHVTGGGPGMGSPDFDTVTELFEMTAAAGCLL